MQSNQVTNDIFGIGYNVACVAGVRKGRGRELGRETTREGPRAPLAFLSRLKNSLSQSSLFLLFQTPVTQASYNVPLSLTPL